jgi:hypothetical protein
MFTAYPDLIACATDLESRTWLSNSHHSIMWRNWYATLVLDKPITWNPTSCVIICFAFYILLCKFLLMKYSQPHPKRLTLAWWSLL